MPNRMGEKVGWIGGWFGSFLWVLILSCIWLFQGKQFESLIGLVLVVIASGVVVAFSPWKNPDIPYWRLMLPIYLVLFGTIVWALWAFDGIENSGLNVWSAFLLLPMMVPFVTIGKRTWNGFKAERPETEID